MANQFSTFSTSYNQRDVTSYITNVSPKDTPLYSLLSRTSGVARQVESLTDALAAANKDNALIEGGTLTNAALTDRSSESNWMQIFTKTMEVSGTQEATLKYGLGMKSELKHQIEKAYLEIGTDIESALINGTGATGTTAAGRKMYGLLAKITTNTATGSLTSDAYTATTTAGYQAFEEKILDLLQTGHTTGQTFDTILASGGLKRRISKLSTKITYNADQMSKKAVMVISSYESDFGEVSVILDRYVPAAKVIALKLDMFSVAYLRPFTQEKLAKTNDSKQVSIIGELTLKQRTEKAGGVLTFS